MKCSQCSTLFEITDAEREFRKKVVMEYGDMMDLIDWYEEFQDKHLMASIREARKGYQKNPEKAIPAEKFFNQWWRKTLDRKEIQTTFSPDQPEIVVCEPCYLSSVY